MTLAARGEEGDVLLPAAGCQDGDVIDGTSNPRGQQHQHQHQRSGVQVRRRLAVCLFLYISGVAIIAQIYPKVILDYFDDDDGKASRFTGWLTFVSSAVQVVAVPSLSSASDAIGRRIVLGGSLALNGAAVLALGLAPNSIVAVVMCQIVSGMCSSTYPVSQAIIIDVSHWGEDAGGGEVTHGLGLIGATFGLAICIGPLLGGSLSEFHRSTACVLSAGTIFLAVLSLRFYGWEETAPGRRLNRARDDASGGRGSACRVVNPFAILKVFQDSSLLTQLSVCLFCYTLALNVYTVFYNYFDYRYHWGAFDISIYTSTSGVVLALTTGVLVRLVVPKRLSEERGLVIGLCLQVVSSMLIGLVPRGWMLYPVLLATLVQYITELCIQAVMARLVSKDRQGSLQGAAMCLRIVGQGIAAPMYGQALSLGVSDAVHNALGFRMPGLPLFLSALSSLLGVMIAWCALRKLDGTVDPDEESRAADCVDAVEEGVDLSSPRSTEGTDSVTTLGTDSAAMVDMTATRTTPFPSNGLVNLDEDTLSEPLLSVAEASPSRLN